MRKLAKLSSSLAVAGSACGAEPTELPILGSFQF